ncbi:D-xylose ABC transporter substrate-binding protein [Lichenicola sp.]|uniref:D-xylose ABC transporter substrate-binding protein n=1 Tax=Lichenicola sp. TaxID=2804529 RepID=UPI003AFF7041
MSHLFKRTAVADTTVSRPGRRRLAQQLMAGAALSLGLGALLPVAAHASPAHPKIGFSIDDLRLERWGHDRDYFIAAAKKLGATVNVQSADASESRQNAQIENLISRGMDVIVIVPFNGKVLGNVINEAKQAGIKIISYDRLILDAPIDAYISFDNVRVGHMQAQGVVNAAPTGNYYLLGGAPTDNNAKLLRQGQMEVLQPLVDANKIKIVGSQWVNEWSATEALSISENALTANKNNIQGFVASNDALAGGAIQALAAQGLAGKVAVSGQDADLAAAQRIEKGTQTMTVYKPLKLIASTAAQMAVDLAKGKTPAYTSKMNNGSADINTILLTPIALTKANVSRLVTDGYFTQAQIDGK